MLHSRPQPIPRRRGLLAACALVLAVIATVAANPLDRVAAQPDASQVTIFDNALGPGIANWSWAPTTLDATDVALSGRSIRVDYGAWGGLSLGYPARVSVPADASLTFGVHGGNNQRVLLNVVAMDADFRAINSGVRVEVAGGEWTPVSIPMADLGNPTKIGGIWWQEVSGANRAGVHFDDIEIRSAASEVEPTPTAETAATPTTAPTPDPVEEPTGQWAFEETFDGDPAAPSQDLLPRSMEYAVTHRSHPKEHFTAAFGPYPADHADNCQGPDPAVVPLPQHQVVSSQATSGANPDTSFFICKNHMMSSMGNVAGYSVTSFWPRQEFNFADGGTLEFEVNINDGHGNRSWWEILLVPQDQLKVAAGPVDSPISETYPEDRIVLDFRRNVRTIKVGEGALAPEGWQVNETQWNRYDFAWWRSLHPDEPALDDRRIRRTMRIQLDGDEIVWGIETPDGSFDEWRVQVPGGLPFDQGLVMFKTHAYNQTKDGNLDTHTFHWDNIRFDGPVLAPYEVYEASDVVYLQRDGDRPIGDQQTVTIDVPNNLENPVLFGQIHQPKQGQVLLSINGGPQIAVTPYEHDRAGCVSSDWKSFRLELEPGQLRSGENTFTWTVGPWPTNCAREPYEWDGFSVKFLQIQTG